MPATDTTEFSDDLALLREAGAEAGRIALRYFRKNPEVWMKGGTSPVSEAPTLLNGSGEVFTASRTLDLAA